MNIDEIEWKKYNTAYGSADKNIPKLLHSLKMKPDDEVFKKTWFDLWSALIHQGTMYSATFLVMPILTDMCKEESPLRRIEYLHFITYGEGYRILDNIELPKEYESEILDSYKQLPNLIKPLLDMKFDETGAQAIGAAISLVNGHALRAIQILRLEDELYCPNCDEELVAYL